MQYRYEAMDAKGMEHSGDVEAPDEASAQATLRQRGYFVTSIRRKFQPSGDYAPCGEQKEHIELRFLPQIVLGVMILIFGIIVGLIVGMNAFPS